MANRVRLFNGKLTIMILCTLRVQLFDVVYNALTWFPRAVQIWLQVAGNLEVAPRSMKPLCAMLLCNWLCVNICSEVRC